MKFDPILVEDGGEHFLCVNIMNSSVGAVRIYEIDLRTGFTSLIDEWRRATPFISSIDFRNYCSTAIGQKPNPTY